MGYCKGHGCGRGLVGVLGIVSGRIVCCFVLCLREVKMSGFLACLDVNRGVSFLGPACEG